MNKKIYISIGLLLLTVSLSILPYILKKTKIRSVDDYRQTTVEFDNPNSYKSKLEAYKVRRDDHIQDTATSIYDDNVNAVQEKKDSAYRLIVTNNTNVAQKHNRTFEDKYSEVSNEVNQEVSNIYSEVKTSTKETSEEKRRRLIAESWDKHSETEDNSLVKSDTYSGVIHNTQLVKTGRTAIFRTKQEICYGDNIIPKNTLLSGVVQMNGSRINIKMEYVRIGSEIISIPLDVYGMDGLPGIPINYDSAQQILSSNTTNEVVRQTGTAISSLGVVGRAVGSIVSSTGSQVKNDKDVEIKLIDNQSVILKIRKKE